MHVTFVYPEISSEINSKGSYHFGIGYLAACLKAAGHSVSLVHLTRITHKPDFLLRLEKNGSSGLVAFSSTSNDFSFVAQLAMWVKERYGCPVICGGVHPTIDPESVISCKDIDMICIGEGEAALVELCNNLDLGKVVTGISNLWVKNDGTIHRNPVRPLREDLDTLPFPDRDIFHYEQLEEMGEKRLTMMASRGCPFNCSYCCNHLIRECYPNKASYMRFRSVNNVIGEIEKRLQDYPEIERIHFHDDILPLKWDWFEEFAASYSKRIRLPFSCNGRVTLMNEGVARTLKASGCVQVNMGIESGNDDIRKQVLDRNIEREQIIAAFRECKRSGLGTYAFNMVGLPFETNKTVLDTIKLNASIAPSKNQVSIFYPYPFTKLYQLCVQKGYIKPGATVDNYFKDTVMQMTSMPRGQILFFQSYFNVLVKIYRIIALLPASLQKPFEATIDRLLCWSHLPYEGLAAMKRHLNLRVFLRHRFPQLYSYLRPLVKKYEYSRHPKVTGGLP